MLRLSDTPDIMGMPQNFSVWIAMIVADVHLGL